MPQRLAITVAGIAAAIVLTVGLVAAGFAPMADPDQPVGSVASEVVVDGIDPPTLPVSAEVVYVEPAPTPETIGLAEVASTASDSSSRLIRVVGVDEEDDGQEREDHDEREDDDEDDDEREDDDDEHEREDHDEGEDDD